jgi:hypothetical protein
MRYLLGQSVIGHRLGAENAAALSPLMITGLLKQERFESIEARSAECEIRKKSRRGQQRECGLFRTKRRAHLPAKKESFLENKGKTMREGRGDGERPGPGELEQSVSKTSRGPQHFTGPPGDETDITQIQKIRQCVIAE